MATCKDCIHENVCIKNRAYDDYHFDSCEEEVNALGCKDFKDKSRYIELPCKPMPLMKDKNPFNSDVYCPYCGTDLSGYYGDEQQSIIQCFNCGEFLDNTKSVTYEEAEKEREQK